MMQTYIRQESNITTIYKAHAVVFGKEKLKNHLPRSYYLQNGDQPESLHYAPDNIISQKGYESEQFRSSGYHGQKLVLVVVYGEGRIIKLNMRD